MTMMKGLFQTSIQPKVALALVSFFLGQLGDGLNIFQVREQVVGGAPSCASPSSTP